MPTPSFSLDLFASESSTAVQPSDAGLGPATEFELASDTTDLCTEQERHRHHTHTHCQLRQLQASIPGPCGHATHSAVREMQGRLIAG